MDNTNKIKEIEINDPQIKETEIEIKDEYIKLSSFLKFCGVAQTGGHATTLIKSNQIKVNDENCEQRGKKLYPGDEVEYKLDKFKVKKLELK